MMSIPKPGSLIFLQDYQTTQQNGSTNYCPGTGSCNTNPKQRQHNAPSEKVEPFTWGAKRMDTDYAAFIGWLRTPLATSFMILLLIALFHHSALGLQVVIEDYVHSDAKFAAVIAVRLGCYGFAVAGIVATLRIAFGG